MSEGGSGAARAGIAALNLLFPGLGLLRIGRLKPALIFLAVPPASLLALLLFYAAVPRLTFAGFAASTLLLFAAYLAALLGSMVLSWRWSRMGAEPRPWWSRWYGIVSAFVLATAISWPLPDLLRGFYKAFYMPAESMMPTLRKGDRLMASMRPKGELRRGDLVLVRAHGSIYLKRVAALPGDRIALRSGTVILNGRAVPQHLQRVEALGQDWRPAQAKRMAEQFPGEEAPHEIYDVGPSAGDDYPEQGVRPGHLFLLGDNRDRSADSRFPPEQFGLDQVPLASVVGRPLFKTWGADGGLAGTLER